MTDPMSPTGKPAQPSISALDAGEVKVSTSAMHDLVGYEMKRAFNVVRSDLLRTLEPFELRMLTFTALVLICENPGLRQSQLAAAMDVERPNVVLLVDELQRRGLARRERSTRDRRAYALSATIEGRRLCDRARAAVQAHEARLLEGLDPATRAAVLQAMRHIQNQASQNKNPATQAREA